MSADLLSILRSASLDLSEYERTTRVVVGLSGGPDSMALAHAFWRWREDTGPAFAAVHVDHHLRPESTEQARQVEQWCWERQIPFFAYEAVFDRPVSTNVEQAARKARYECFAGAVEQFSAEVLALAHHADDQAETLLLHLLRGSGLAGLAGMAPVQRKGDLLDSICSARSRNRPAVWRPLLDVRRAAILEYCDRWQLTPIHDPSNDDITLRRNAIRHRIMPLLEEHFPGAGGILARNASLLAAEEEWLQVTTDEMLTFFSESEELPRLVELESGLATIARGLFRDAVPALQRRILRATWGKLRDNAALIGLNAATIEAARFAILTGKTGSRHALPGDLLLIVDRDTAVIGPTATLETQLRQRLALPLVARDWRCDLPGAGTLPLDAEWSVEVLPPGADPARGFALHIPLDAGAPLIFRTWQPGDRVALYGRDGSRKLQDWFTDQRIPGYARHYLPLLARGNRVLWIVGLAVFPPVGGEPLDGEVITLRLLYNGTPVELNRATVIEQGE